LARKVTVGLVERNDSLGPTTRFMTNVTCGLTAKKPGSAPHTTLVNRVCDYFTLISQFQLFMYKHIMDMTNTVSHLSITQGSKH